MNLEEWFYFDSDDWIGPMSLADIRTLASNGRLKADSRIACDGMYGRGISIHEIDAKYYVQGIGKYQSYYSEEDLWSALDDGAILPDAKVISPELGIRNARVDSLKKSPLRFKPTINELIEERKESSTTVFCGPNNSGKTLLLKTLQFSLGRSAYLVLPSRFQHLGAISHSPFTDEQSRQLYSTFVTNYLRQTQNDNNNRLNLQQIFGSLSTSNQDQLLRIASELLDVDITIKQTDPDSRMSPWYLDFGGQEFSVSSSGTRLLFLLLATCMIPSYSEILIDEPELGLSPKVQKIISNLLLDPSRRSDRFPHLKKVWIATHSHLFLDKSYVSNNYSISRHEYDVELHQITSFAGFHNLQFEMLGNELSSLSLPSAIVIVEGGTDSEFIDRVIQLRHPEKRITTIRAEGDGIKNVVNTLKQALGDISSSPYSNRIFIVLDQQHSVKKQNLTNAGINPNHIIEWSKNGIEHLYPKKIMAELFGCSINDAQEKLSIQGNFIEINGTRKSKKELADKIVARLTKESVIDQEFETKFMTKIASLY